MKRRHIELNGYTGRFFVISDEGDDFFMIFLLILLHAKPLLIRNHFQKEILCNTCFFPHLRVITIININEVTKDRKHFETKRKIRGIEYPNNKFTINKVCTRKNCNTVTALKRSGPTSVALLDAPSD